MPPESTTSVLPLTADAIKAALDADPAFGNWRRQLFEPVALQLPTILGSVLDDPFTLENMFRVRLLVMNYLATSEDYINSVGGLPGLTPNVMQELLGHRTMDFQGWLHHTDVALRRHGLTEERAMRIGPPHATDELMRVWSDGGIIAAAVTTQISYILMVT